MDLSLISPRFRWKRAVLVRGLESARGRLARLENERADLEHAICVSVKEKLLVRLLAAGGCDARVRFAPANADSNRSGELIMTVAIPTHPVPAH